MFGPSREWYFTWKHDIKHDSHGPYVDLAVVFLKEYFWGDIVWRSTHGVHSVLLCEILWKSEIYHFYACHIVFFVEHKVLGFYISMWYLFGMKILQSREQLLHDICCHVLWKKFILNDIMEKFSAVTISIKCCIKIWLTYSKTKKQTSFHSQISCNLMILVWSYISD